MQAHTANIHTRTLTHTHTLSLPLYLVDTHTHTSCANATTLTVWHNKTVSMCRGLWLHGKRGPLISEEMEQHGVELCSCVIVEGGRNSDRLITSVSILGPRGLYVQSVVGLLVIHLHLFYPIPVIIFPHTLSQTQRMKCCYQRGGRLLAFDVTESSSQWPTRLIHHSESSVITVKPGVGNTCDNGQ